MAMSFFPGAYQQFAYNLDTVPINNMYIFGSVYHFVLHIFRFCLFLLNNKGFVLSFRGEHQYRQCAG